MTLEGSHFKFESKYFVQAFIYIKRIDSLWVVVEVENVSEIITSQRKVGEIGQNLGVDLGLDPEVVVLKGIEIDIHGGAEEKGKRKGTEDTKKEKREEIGIALPRFQKMSLEEAVLQNLIHQTQRDRLSVKIQEQTRLKTHLVWQE